jgi:hypothetical protein
VSEHTEPTNLRQAVLNLKCGYDMALRMLEQDWADLSWLTRAIFWRQRPRITRQNSHILMYAEDALADRQHDCQARGCHKGF